MANGDKPPGGVTISITAPTISKGFTIECHTEEDADKFASEVIEAIEKLQEEYGKH